MYAAGARVFVEAGPGSVLGGLVGKILDGRPHTVVSLGDGGLRGFLTGLARLAAAGVDVRAGWLHTGRPGLDLTFAEPPARPRWTVDGHLVRTHTGEVVPGGLAPARPVNPFANPRTDRLPHSSDRDALVADFLRTSRELVSAQRDVMLSYLGAAPVPAPPMPAASPLPQPAALPAGSHAAGSAAPSEEADQPVVDPLTSVVAVIGRKTGYPAEMIEPDMDLEADLSVDSIKRTEIAVELAAALENGSALVDELVRSRTAAAMAKVLVAPGTEEPAAVAPSPDAPRPEVVVPGEQPRRHVIEPRGSAGGRGRHGAGGCDHRDRRRGSPGRRGAGGPALGERRAPRPGRRRPGARRAAGDRRAGLVARPRPCRRAGAVRPLPALPVGAAARPLVRRGGEPWCAGLGARRLLPQPGPRVPAGPDPVRRAGSGGRGAGCRGGHGRTADR